MAKTSTIRCDGDDVSFILDQHSYLNIYTQLNSVERKLVAEQTVMIFFLTDTTDFRTQIIYCPPMTGIVIVIIV
jgi:hypothetical protein